MNSPALQALLNLLALTPMPPPGDWDPSDVIAQAHDMTQRRAGAVEHLRQILANNDAIMGEGEAILREINERAAGWQAALERARHELCLRMHAARHVRRRVSSSTP